MDSGNEVRFEKIAALLNKKGVAVCAVDALRALNKSLGPPRELVRDRGK